ncbi:Ent-kaurenoic acid oxidase, putative [Ricinus communis]|uniref:Ent-kaurenoic acid oxidase, putative n=1 Tax=Ricinus communis TaxID=3988 RepID=B9SEB4_RICCO|nr:Ent-kaurenoic acid oxidase, putative [Ricinus communis]|eukprot:XP_002524333.1 abscisic acid 8'-hydroxylase 3 [Ricinus communis]
MLKLSKEELLFLAQNKYDIVMVALFSIAVFAVLKAWRKKITTSNKEDIPGGLGLPFVGETLSFLSATNSTRGCYDFVRLRRKWYGKWFKTRIFGKIHVFAPSTEAARKVFTNDFGEFNKGYIKSMATVVGEKSVFAVPLESHKRIRHILSALFSIPSLSIFVQNFDQMLSQRLKNLQERGITFAVLDFTMKLTLDSMCNMLMSITEESLLKQILRDCAAVSDALLSVPLMIPGTTYYKGMKARERLMEIFKEKIARRRSGEEYKDDFLQSLLERDSYPSSERLQDSEIMDNLLTLLVSGQVSSAATMMWSVKFLDENKEVLDKLREEQSNIAKNMQGASLSMVDLNKMSYCYKVVKESLRMSNAVLWLPRVAQKDCTVDGFEIKKGWNVNVDATHIHYDPALYKDPLRFNPSRFDEMQKPYSFIPFGAGPRTCLGIEMAKLSMLVFIHRLTSEYEWRIEDPDPSLERTTHVPRLRTGLPITLKPLKSASQD